MQEVLVTLAGGLGNQMFQYAVARGIAYRNDCVLKIDRANYLNVSPTTFNLETRTFGLNHYNISAQIAERVDYPWFFSSSIRFRIWRFLQRQGLLNWQWKVINEPKNNQYHFDPGLVNLNCWANIWLMHGFWQSPKYFADITDILRKEFTLKESLDPRNIAMVEEICSKKSVGIHIRRGDYAYNLEVSEMFGTLDLSYYYQAINLIASQIPDPHFFVFSDDPGWVQDQLKLSYPVNFVTINDKQKDYLDMYLMSRCEHHIIANSSFSYWAAWLGKNRNQIVVAPAKPFKKLDIHIEDFYPQEWQLI